MKTRKKWFAALLTAALLLTGCSSGSSSSGSSDRSSALIPEDAKVLVAYFSATGNTKSAAQMIADELDADLFEITPTDPYTDDDLDWTNDNSRVVQEHENEDLQDIELTTTEVENWDSYDVVLIGYPIWWGDAAWPVNNFVKNNDFSGKTVIPFCTSSESGIGDSGDHLAEMAGTGDWQKGHRFASDVSEEDVEEWIDSIEED
ncbi:MAG: flavodoxin [Catenisphaera adipataccumulans]|jgi:flavodoxin|uniref:flavodoxin n=1 Tax=Catenisphaera adipataccumulans TaxID=700500 RepID=UPI003D8BD524